MSNSEMESNEFAQLLEESLNEKDHFHIGEQANGTLIQIGEETSFVSLSGKTEASMATSEIRDKEGNLLYSKGDVLEVYVSAVKNGGIQVTREIGKGGEMNTQLLRAAFEGELPVEGVVKEETRGGFRVDISGILCFCPFSQIDIKPDSTPANYIGKNLKFKIIEFKERGRNIVLSRKELLLKVRREAEERLKETLHIGDRVNGKLVSIHKFGIFIDLGGVEALVPKSEISWSRNPDLKSLKKEESIEAVVIDLDWGSSKITLSIKQLTEEPWSEIDKFELNSPIQGKVSNLINSGAFIEIAPGIEGFLHISRFSLTKKINKPEEVLSRGDMVTVKIISIDRNSKKMSLELITGEADPWLEIDSAFHGRSHRGVVESSRNNGINLRLENGLLGFIPAGELFKSGDIAKDYPTGSEVTVGVKDCNMEKRSLILSEKLAAKKDEEQAYNSFIEKNNEGDSGSTLGNLFKDQFEELKRNIEKK